MSGHLVKQVVGPIAPAALCDQLREAHRFLVSAAMETVPRMLRLSPDTWGTAAKREYVVLHEGVRPLLVSEGVATHAFAEIVNQCATLERLIDTLAWAGTVPDLKHADVTICNPTTSSAPKKKDQPRVEDHDLILKTGAGDSWKFEVSDVASTNDSNGKELKDLVALGVLPGDSSELVGWPSGRCHLVVSQEFAERIRKPTRHGLRLGTFHYDEVKKDGGTRIFEVRQGPPPA